MRKKGTARVQESRRACEEGDRGVGIKGKGGGISKAGSSESKQVAIEWRRAARLLCCVSGHTLRKHGNQCWGREAGQVRTGGHGRAITNLEDLLSIVLVCEGVRATAGSASG